MGDLMTAFPYKFLTIRTTPSFCEGIWFAPRLEQNRPAPRVESNIVLLDESAEAQIRPASRSQAACQRREGAAIRSPVGHTQG
jgi:hypothetical protein